MSEGANATAVSSVGSPTPTTTTATTTTIKTTLECCDEPNSETLLPPQPPPPPPPPPDPPSETSTKKSEIVRKPRRRGTVGHTFHLIDGKKIRSALTRKKWPPRPRRVSFPTNDNDLVTGYLEPANPWEHAENVNIGDLISSYKASCERHGTEPLEHVIEQLEKLDISDDERCTELCLKHECIDQYHCEPLEEILKRVQFEKIDVESSSLDDESATILFEMLEYYQSARHLNMSSNRNIGSRGWQSCAYMIKKTTCLEQFEARDITLTQQHMNILKRPLQLVSHLHVLKLENCGLAGRAFVILVAALKMNTGLKELYLADNCLEQEDAIQLGALLRINNHLQLLDISNNHIKDEGVRDLLDGLIAQSSDNRHGKGLSILVLWNNDLTKSSSPHFSDAITQSVTLETLNIGKNSVSNELLELAQDSLIKTRTLLQLGMQSTNLTCKGALLLANIIERNRTLQRIDLRDNNIQMEGLAALSFAMKRNTCITQLDLDDAPWSKAPATMNQYVDLVAEIRGYCVRNDESMSTDESTEESSSPQHRSRLSSVSSRKISLTCQTLPRSPPSINPNPINDITTRSMLEPKRTSGGRLRSPAPSPIPSPVASPIPSPSRGRFVVSRVCETSLSSTNSSASSSPVTPPSLASSPTCFFPNTVAGRSSRFRVTVVETTNSHVPSTKSVVTSANTNITIGFNYKVQKPESVDSDDSDSVFRSEVDHCVTMGNELGENIEDEIERACTVETVKETAKNVNEEIERTTNEDNLEIDESKCLTKVPDTIEDNQIDKVVKEEIKTAENGGRVDNASEMMENFVKNDSTEIQESRETEVTKLMDNTETKVIEMKVNSPKRTQESLRDEIMACYQSEPKKPEPTQRQATSLERLLGLFQHPGSLFSSSSFVERTETKNPIQDGVNSMIALGDKFQQYLRDGRGKAGSEDSSSHAPLQRSVSDASRSTIKLDPVKSLSIPQLSSIQASCTRNVAPSKESFKITEKSEENVSSRMETNISKTRKIFVVNESPVDNCPIKIVEDKVHRISDDLLLPENMQTDDEKERNDEIESIESVGFVVLAENVTSSDNNSSLKIVNNPSSSLITECITSVCSEKLQNIQENSILEIRETCQVETTSENDELSLREKNVDTKHVNDVVDDVKIKCDSSTTDSINDLSYKNSSLCKITCDISGVKNVHTLVDNTDDVHNFFNSPLSHHDNDDDDNDGEDETKIGETREKEPTITISASTSQPEDRNFTITTDQLERAKCVEEINSDCQVDSSEIANMTVTMINLEDLNCHDDTKNKRDKLNLANKQLDNVANNVDLSLPVLNNSFIKYNNDERSKNAQDVRDNVTRLDDKAITEDVNLTETIEEFLPLDAAASFSKSCIVNQQFATELTNNCIYNNSNDDALTENKQKSDIMTIEDCEKNNFTPMSEETRETTTTKDEILPIEENIVKETIIMSEGFVKIPNVGTSVFSSTRVALASTEDEDYVQASIEQVSTSLSEDSDYSSKFSIDDVRTGELSLSGSTANSPGNETIEQIITETSIINKNSLGSINSHPNDPSLKTTEQRSFVRVAVESVLTSILQVTDTTASVGTSSEVKTSESTEDLIFKMTDITNDPTTISNEITSDIITRIEVCEDDSRGIVDCYYEAGQSSRSNANLFIEKSRNVHRNSQDSGIEETTASITDDNVLEANCQPRESFQESVDSGIDSECSSVCARVDVGADVQKERARDPGKLANLNRNVDFEIPDFSTNLIDMDGILVVQEIARFADNSSKIQINDERNVPTKISDVISIGRSKPSTEITSIVGSSTSPQ